MEVVASRWAGHPDFKEPESIIDRRGRLAMHTATLTRHRAAPELIAALRAGTALPGDRLEALRRFTLAVLDRRGAVPEEELTAFLAAGYLPRNALDVVLGVGTYTISTFANRLVDAPLDPPLAAYAWTPADPVPTASA
ncbi:carboxymuconolactone decarboxylase family protein [Micromonospora musae]|uniref:carboxymuconolactone decarboxylase family protein n=1 Tax=Micromonospora musae TaxID=1894970 RepID=UPI001F2A903E|nr:hypothetical protein [Micromonospora musae]